MPVLWGRANKFGAIAHKTRGLAGGCRKGGPAKKKVRIQKRSKSGPGIEPSQQQQQKRANMSDRRASTTSVDYHELARVFTEAGSDFGVPRHDPQRAEEHLARWYESVMTLEQLKDAIEEKNTEKGVNGEGLIDVPSRLRAADRPRMAASLARADFLSDVMPYESASVACDIAALRTTLRLSGKIMTHDDKAEMVVSIKDKLRRPMLTKGSFPSDLKEQVDDRTEGEAAFPFQKFMSQSAEKVREEGGKGTPSGDICPPGAAVADCPHTPRCKGLRSTADLITEAVNQGMRCPSADRKSARAAKQKAPQGSRMRRARDSDSEESEDSDDEDARSKQRRVGHAAVFGGLAARRTGGDWAELELGLEKDTIVTSQNAKRKSGSSAHCVLYNQSLDREIKMMIELAKLKSKERAGHLSEKDYLEARNVHLVQLSAITEELKVYTKCIELEQLGEAGARKAEYLSREYQEALSGDRQDKITEGLVKKANKKYKQDRDHDVAQSLDLLTRMQQRQLEEAGAWEQGQHWDHGQCQGYSGNWSWVRGRDGVDEGPGHGGLGAHEQDGERFGSEEEAAKAEAKEHIIYSPMI